MRRGKGCASGRPIMKMSDGGVKKEKENEKEKERGRRSGGGSAGAVRSEHTHENCN